MLQKVHNEADHSLFFIWMRFCDHNYNCNKSMIFYRFSPFKEEHIIFFEEIQKYGSRDTLIPI